MSHHLGSPVLPHLLILSNLGLFSHRISHSQHNLCIFGLFLEYSNVFVLLVLGSYSAMQLGQPQIATSFEFHVT